MKVLFLLGGYGLGNSTRCYQLINQLIAKGDCITIASFANGLNFYKKVIGISALIRLRDLNFNTVWNPVKFLAYLYNTIISIFANNWIIYRHVRLNKPELIVSDSDYSFMLIRLLGHKVISINNSNLVLKTFINNLSSFPYCSIPKVIFVEFFDYLYHLFFSTSVFCPSFTNVKANHRGKFINIGPITRAKKHGLSNNKSRNKSLLVISGGSTHTLSLDLTSLCNYDIYSIGNNNILSHPSCRLHSLGKTLTNDIFDIIDSVELVITRGGYSSLVELLVLAKPMVIIPIKCHPEQLSNALQIHKLGVGVISTEENIVNNVYLLLENINQYHANYDKLSVEDNSQMLLTLLRDKHE